MNILYTCYLSGVKFAANAAKAGATSATGTDTIPLFALHPMLTVSPKELEYITNKAIKSECIGHVHLVAWLVQLSHCDLVTSLDNRLYRRFPDLGQAFTAFYVPWLIEIYKQVKSHSTSTKHGNLGAIPSLPKMALTPDNLAPLLDSDSEVTSQNELIKRSLISWASSIRESLNLTKIQIAHKATTHADAIMADKEAERKLALGKPRNLKLLAGYMRTCLTRRVMAPELNRAIQAIYEIDKISLVQVKHLRQLLLDYGLTNFVDQQLAYSELMAICNKTIADRAGLSSLLELSGTSTKRTDSKSISEIASKAAPVNQGFRILPTTPPINPPATTANNRMLAAIKARKNSKG